MDTLSRIICLLEQRGHTQSELTEFLGIKKSAFTDWKAGKSKSYVKYASNIADYFGVSVDYLLGRTNDPVDYEQDGDALAQIPLSYVEACGGDLKRARAMMEAADADVTGERRTSFVKRKMPTAKNSSEQPKAKLRSISRLEDSEITPEQDEEISNYIEYLLSKRGKE